MVVGADLSTSAVVVVFLVATAAAAVSVAPSCTFLHLQYPILEFVVEPWTNAPLAVQWGVGRRQHGHDCPNDASLERRRQRQRQRRYGIVPCGGVGGGGSLC